MAEILKYLKTNIYLLAIFTLSLLIFIPTFNIKFSWIDDGWNIMLAKNLLVEISELNLPSVIGSIVESNIGRFRPVYWIWQTTVFILGGSNSSIHYFLHFILIISIVFVTYKIIYFFSKSAVGSFVGSTLVLVYPLNAENWVRLGPQEPFMVLFILLSIYSYFSLNSLKKAIIFIVLAFLTKETAIAIVPGFVIYYLMMKVIRKKDKHLFKYVVWLILLSLVSLMVNLLNRKGYSNSYVFDLQNIIYNFKLYLGFVTNSFSISILFVLSLLIRNIRPIVNFQFKKINNYEILKVMFLTLFFAFIIVQSPWAWVLNRYLLPAIVMGSIFVGLEFSSILSFLSKYKYLYILFCLSFSAYFGFFVIQSTFKINEQIVRQKHSTNNIYLGLKHLSQITPTDGRVYFNFVNNDATYEPLFESDLHFKLFFNRHDIKIDFIENKQKKESGYLVISGTPLGSFPYHEESYFRKDRSIKKQENFGNDSKFIVISDFETVSKQIIKKLYRFLKSGEKIDGSGIYTDYLLKDTWSIYYY